MLHLDRADADAVAGHADAHVVFGSFSSSKNDLSAFASASSSRTSPSTTMPSASGRRASWMSSWSASVRWTTAARLEAPDLETDNAAALPD
jgi:hypothetical protein